MRPKNFEIRTRNVAGVQVVWAGSKVTDVRQEMVLVKHAGVWEEVTN